MESEINTYRINNFDNIKRNHEEDLSFEMQQFIKIELDPVHYISQVIDFINMLEKLRNDKVEGRSKREEEIELQCLERKIFLEQQQFLNY